MQTVFVMSTASIVNSASMTYLDDKHDKLAVINVYNYSIITDAQAIALFSNKLFDVCLWAYADTLERAHDALLDSPFELGQLLLGAV